MAKRTPQARSRKGAPGIVDVAHRAGVSPATVSRFFNYPDMLVPKTRTRIAKAAAELGYIRDRMAGTLHNRFSGTMGLVVPTIDNAIFAELIEAFSNRLQQHDRNMLLASHNYDLQLEVSIIRSLLERRIDGLAIVGHDHEPAALEMLKVRAVPVVALWNYRSDSAIPFIGADNAAAADCVTQHLIDLGHRDIALLFPDTEQNDRARDRKNGAMQALERNGLNIPPERHIKCEYSVGHAKQLVTQLIAENRPTALVCGNDIIAHGALYAGIQSGLKLPEELSVVGIGDFRSSADIEPGLTTVRLPARRIGRMAADTIVRISQQRKAAALDMSEGDVPVGVDASRAGGDRTDRLAAVENVKVETQLLVRQSTCACKA